MLRKDEVSKVLDVAAGNHQVTDDSARLVLGWMDPDGRIAAPNERCAGLAREVLEAAGLEFRLAKGPDPAKTPGEAGQTEPETAAPDANRREKAGEEPAASKPATRSAAARSRSAAAWARKHPLEASAMLAHHPVVMDELLAADAAGSADGVELREVLEYLALNDIEGAPQSITDRVFLLASRLPSSIEAGGEPLSILAAARERLGADQRAEGMLPATPRVRVIETPEDRNRLPELLPDPSLEERQRILPTLEAAGDRKPGIGPAPWLQVFDRLGGRSMEAGRGAPLPLRLWVESLAWAPPAARRGRLVDVELEVRDLVQALWPDGWNRGKQLPRLRDACAAVNGLGWISDSEGRTEWAPVLFRRRPGVAATLSDPVLLQVQLPPVEGAGAGARFNRETLRRLGLRSAPAYRLYLGLVAEWDRLGRRGVPPTWPGFGKAARRRLIFGPDETAGAAATIRSRQRDADRAFEALAKFGAIALERDKDDPRVYRPRRLDLD